MERRKLWMILPGQFWPMDATEEKGFYKKLLTMSSKSLKFDRDDLSVLMLLLRNGSAVEKILEIAPGVKPGALRSAYEKIEDRREKAVESWALIEKNPQLALDRKNLKWVKMVMPQIYDKLISSDNDEIDLTVRVIGRRINEIRRLVTIEETLLKRYKNGEDEGLTIGVKLYNPYNPGLYGSPYYLPDRVSSLTPVRVNELMRDLFKDEDGTD